jgi:hypothetical protein
MQQYAPTGKRQEQLKDSKYAGNRHRKVRPQLGFDGITLNG